MFNGPVCLPLLTDFLYYINIARELSVLPDGQMERRNPLPVEAFEVFDDLAVGSVIDVHVCNEEHAGQVILLAEIPGPTSSGFDAVLP